MTTDRENSEVVSGDFLDVFQFPKWDIYFSRHLNKWFVASLALLVISGILLFDLRISEGGDDSSYLMEAMLFSKGESFPSFHGILYSMFLGWMIKLSGFHLVLFKFFSFVFLLVHQFVFYFTFRKRISPFLLSALLIILSISSGIIYYGSQTYTEAFYMMLQALLLYFVIHRMLHFPGNFIHIKSEWKSYLLIGFLLFLLVKTRNIGLIAVAGLLIYLIIEKKYYNGLFTLISYFVFTLPYMLYKKIVWGMGGHDAGSQLNILLQKDPYNRSLGYENLWGMVTRLFENSKIYLSGIFLQETGLRDPANDGSGYVVTIILAAILVTGLIISFRERNKVLLFLFIYLGTSLVATFLSVSQIWSQSRLIIIYLPLLLLCMSWTLAQIGREDRLAFMRLLTVSLLLLITLKNLTHTVHDIINHYPILKKNLAGDRYFGYTPDLANFLKMSEWAAGNIPLEEDIASRKPGMSFVYGNGRIFRPMHKLPFVETDSVLDMATAVNGRIAFVDDLRFEKEDRNRVIRTKRFLKAIVTFDNDVYSLIIAGEDQSGQLDSLLNLMPGLDPIYTVEAFRKEVVEKNNTTTSLYPDQMLKELSSENIQYLIQAQLRANPGEKTGETLNTVERWMVAINSKYPGAFKLVNQIGRDKNEPARLYHVDYTQCRKLGWTY
jgi:hypothetical protein